MQQSDAQRARAEAEAIFEAARSGDVAALRACGADCAGLRDAHGRSPLHFSAAHGHSEACLHLATQTSDIDAQDADGRSALHLAAAAGHVGVAEVLLAQGCTAVPQARDGTTPLHLAAAIGSAELLRLLIARGGPETCDALSSVGGAMHYAAGSGHADAVKLMLELRAEADLRGPDGVTPLMMAAAAGSGATVRALCDHGARVTAVGDEGSGRLSPLLAAAGNGQLPSIEALLEGCDTDTVMVACGHRNSDGLNAAEVAAYGNHSTVAAALLRAASDDSDLAVLLARMREQRERDTARAVQEATEASADAEAARQRGNERFVAKDYETALAEYKVAADGLRRLKSAAPVDPTALPTTNRVPTEPSSLSKVLSNSSACWLKLSQSVPAASKAKLRARALDDAVSSVTESPGWFKAHWRCGKAHEAAGNYADAAQSFWEAFQLTSREADAAQEKPGAGAQECGELRKKTAMMLRLFESVVAKGKASTNAGGQGTAKREHAERKFDHDIPVEVPTNAGCSEYRTLRLCFDDKEAPLDVAVRFIREHGLDPSLHHRIAAHVHGILQDR